MNLRDVSRVDPIQRPSPRISRQPSSSLPKRHNPRAPSGSDTPTRRPATGARANPGTHLASSRPHTISSASASFTSLLLPVVGLGRPPRYFLLPVRRHTRFPRQQGVPTRKVRSNQKGIPEEERGTPFLAISVQVFPRGVVRACRVG